MIKIEKITVWGFEHAIRGMRNPLNSWDRSDSGYFASGKRYEDVDYVVGKDDLRLMRTLYGSGTEHRKFLRQIFVSMDITAPLYWWKEFDTYKIGTTANSCSTMHTIHKKEFVIDDFSHENLHGIAFEQLYKLIDVLNLNRERYLQTRSKEYWWNLIQLLPSSYNQKRTLTFNYENVSTMIRQRKDHKLDEWRTFVGVLKDLPYVREIMAKKANTDVLEDDLK